jgi:hypothetical protein
MSACNFSIPFTSSPEEVFQKAKKSVESQGGTFNGDTNGGSFELSIFGNAIIGAYTVSGQELNVVIEEKPFLVPCSMIEGFLKKQVGQ